MFSARSNLGDVRAALRSLRALGDMTADAGGETLGRVAQRSVGAGLRERYVDRQEQPGGAPLPDLAPSTLADKRRHGYPDTVLVRTGLMLSAEQLEGERVADGKALTLTYGRRERARLEMEWATSGWHGRRPPPDRPERPGYELDDAVESGHLEPALRAGLDAQARALGCSDAG